MDVLMKRGYTTFTRLDQGGQARVYKSERNGKTVAIKVVHVENPDSPKLDADLKRELQIVRNVRHPNCIKVEELFRTKNKIYIIMDYMPYGTIGSYIRMAGPICEWNARIWFCPIARAVKYLHEHNIAHRDLKLDNILLDAYMNPVVSDFGYSLFVQQDENGQVVKSHSYCGTISHNPPELLKQTPYDPFKCDIWCLGVMLFILLNKIYPFDKRDRKKMYENQMSKNYHLERAIEAKLTNMVKHLITILLEPLPADRPSIEDVCNHPWFPIILRENEFIGRRKKQTTDQGTETDEQTYNPESETTGQRYIKTNQVKSRVSRLISSRRIRSSAPRKE